MTHIRDLEPCTYFGTKASRCLVAVGWLDARVSYERGPASTHFVEKLALLAHDAWEFSVFCGSHRCTLDSCESRPSESRNLFIPTDAFIYAAPQMVLHYVQDHSYSPPPAFVSAVLDCPTMNSDEYLATLIRISTA